MKLYLVSAKNGEFVGFTDRKDATWTAKGGCPPGPFGAVPTLGDSFREGYGDDDEDAVFPMIEIDLTPEQVKACQIPKAK